MWLNGIYAKSNSRQCMPAILCMRFFFGGGGAVLKYLHGGLLGLTGSQLKSGHVRNALHCFSACEVLCVMLSTFPPFGKYTVSMLGACLLQGCHVWLCITLSCCSWPHKATNLWGTSPCVHVDEINNKFSQIIDCIEGPCANGTSVLLILVKHESFNFFCSLVNNSYFFCRTWRDICCYWCERITTKCKWGICNFQWGPQVFCCSLILQINVNTNLILLRNHWWVASYQRSSCVI